MKRFFFKKCTGSDSSSKNVKYVWEEKENSLRVFTYQELKDATKNFSTIHKIGEGSYGDFYKGSILPPNGKGHGDVVAIKTLNTRFTSYYENEEWLEEVQFHSSLSHPNLVNLLGYCSLERKGDNAKQLLVYEFMPNSTLEQHLFNKRFPFLPWKTRLEIMLGAAQALAYLHHGLETQVWYGDFKSSSVLLDRGFQPKLSGFGLGTKGDEMNDPNHPIFVVGGEYNAPEYISTGHKDVKNDMWSFGVVLYEILTGRRAIERNREIAAREDMVLVEWVKRYPVHSPTFSCMMDPRLKNQYSMRAARKIANLANSCVNINIKDRPSMTHIVEALEELLRQY